GFLDFILEMLAGFELFPDQVVAKGTVKVYIGPVEFFKSPGMFYDPDQNMLYSILYRVAIGGDGVSKFDKGIVMVMIKILNSGFTSAGDVVEDCDQYIDIVRFGGHTGTAIL